MQYLVRNASQNTWLDSFNSQDQTPNWIQNKADANVFPTKDHATVAKINAEGTTTDKIVVISVYTPKLPTFKSVEKNCNEDNHQGWCLYCGKWTHDSCEPDARKYECPKCHNNTCFGAEQLVIENLFK